MNNKKMSPGLDEQIRQQIEAWRKREACTEELLDRCDRLADVNPLLGVWGLFDTIRSGRRLYKRYLRSRFGYKVGSKDFKSTTRDRFIRPQRLPNNAEENTLYTFMFAEWAAYEGAFIVLMPTLERELTRPDTDEYRALRKECRRILLGVYGAVVAKLRLSRSYADNRLHASVCGEREIAWFSGWVAAQTSLERNQRLARSLKEVSNSAFGGFLQELPGTTLIELDNLVRKTEQPSKLARRVARHLEKAGSQAINQKPGKIVQADYTSDGTIDETTLEEFVAKEKLETLRASTKLSAREDQVLELMLKDYLDREIACELGINEGSVKTTKFRMREKLTQAAGR